MAVIIHLKNGQTVSDAPVVNGRQVVRFAPNILDPNGPPIPIYPDGTFPTKQMPGIKGTPSGSFCPVGPGHIPPTAEEMAKYCRCTVDQYLAGLPAAVAALNGQAAPRPAVVDDFDPLADWTADVPPSETAAFAHWQQFGKGPGRDAKRWAAISAVVKATHQKAARAAAK